MGKEGSEPDSSNVDKRRLRPDRAAKRQRCMVMQEAVVKAALLKHLRGASTKGALRNAIQDRVEAYSKRVHLASIALSGLVKQCFHGHQDVLQAALPDFTSTTFFRQLMLGVDSADKKDPYVQAYYQAHPLLLAKLREQGRHQGDSNIYSAGAVLYETNFKNHFTTNFRRRLHKWLKLFQKQHALTDDQRTWVLFTTCGWNTRHLNPPVQPLPVMQEAAAQQRRVLGLAGATEVTEAWLKRPSNLASLVRHAVHACRYLEERGQPAFDLVPIAKRGAHYITIDTMGLHGLMKEVGLVRCGLDPFTAMRTEHWNSVLKLDSLLGRQDKEQKTASKERTFTGTINTDGISLCVHYQTPKLEPVPIPVVSSKPGTEGPLADRFLECTVLGMDPGRINIYYFALQHLDGSTKSWALTRNHYYAASGICKARKQSEAWQKAVQEELEMLSQVSTKGTSVADHEWYLLTNLHVWERVWEEYLKPRWGRQRLRLYGGKQRTFATFLGRVKREATLEGGGKPVVVAYGAAKFAPTGKGEVAVPTSQAYKECVRRFQTVVVDEFRTTATSAVDGTVLKKVRSATKDAEVRGLLWYQSTSACKFVTRDLNAALNIRQCAILQQRPAWLCRLPRQGRLQPEVGKTIKC